MNTLRIALAATATALTLAAPANAAVFTYDAVIGNGIGAAKLVIDGDAGTARYSGTNIDLTLSGDSFKGFDGAAGSKQTLRADAIDGTFTRNGTTYDAYASTRPKHTLLQISADSNFLWTYGKDGNGRTFDFDGKGSLSLVSSCQTACGGGSSSGGSSSGGGTSSGGGQVPAPAPLALIAAMGLFGAWRRKKIAKD